MNILLKAALIADPDSSHFGKKADILIENGIIKSIRKKLVAGKGYKVIEEVNLNVSSGWLDMQVNFCDPGYEHKEDIESGIRAAAAGGFTGVATVSGTNPPVHSKAQVQYIINKSAGAIVDVYPIGTISHNREGKDLAEMYDMQQAGAIAFSDDKKPITDAGLLLRALQYSMNFDGLVITHCDEHSISMDGQMNEGISSTSLGLKGIPALAEELMISRNIALAEYSGAALHISNVSAEGSVELIRAAKQKGLKITSSVNAYNLALEDSVLQSFDSNYKLNPPLRTKKDIAALKKGVADGTIDAVTSDHRPQDIESKDVEFEHASAGIIGLETMFPLLNTFRDKLKLPEIIRLLSSGPRSVLNLAPIAIEENTAANLTLFDPVSEWILEKKNIRSKSSNTPFQDFKFRGKVIGIINNKQVHINR